MTNKEEAIEQLNHMKKFIGYDEENPLVKRMQSALDMAIKALESKEGINKCANDSCSFAMEIEDMCDDCKERNIRW